MAAAVQQSGDFIDEIKVDRCVLQQDTRMFLDACRASLTVEALDQQPARLE
jgi:hypothetical protein